MAAPNRRRDAAPGQGRGNRGRGNRGRGNRGRGAAPGAVQAKFDEDANLPTIDQDITNIDVEAQEGLGCGRHTLNNFLGKSIFGNKSPGFNLASDVNAKKKKY